MRGIGWHRPFTQHRPILHHPSPSHHNVENSFDVLVGAQVKESLLVYYHSNAYGLLEPLLSLYSEYIGIPHLRTFLTPC
jgi:hypothetical protein